METKAEQAKHTPGEILLDAAQKTLDWFDDPTGLSSPSTDLFNAVQEAQAWLKGVHALIGAAKRVEEAVDIGAAQVPAAIGIQLGRAIDKAKGR